MLKKLIALMMMLTLSVYTIGCGGGDDADSPENTENPTNEEEGVPEGDPEGDPEDGDDDKDGDDK